MDIYQNRDSYRSHVNGASLCHYRVTIKETDLYIASPGELSKEAEAAIVSVRSVIEQEILKNPDFLHSLHPLDLSPEDPEIIRRMKMAGIHAHVGPMAAVAGMVSEAVGLALLKDPHDTIIVENGGDIFLRSDEPLSVVIHAPGSPLSDQLALSVPCTHGMGVCTSSGTYGHSLSFGRSQAAVVVSPDTVLSDAAATRLGNLLKDSGKIEASLQKILQVPNVLGAVAIVDDKIGFMGDVTLTAAPKN